jgi:hypothetical protein
MKKPRRSKPEFGSGKDKGDTKCHKESWLLLNKGTEKSERYPMKW